MTVESQRQFAQLEQERRNLQRRILERLDVIAGTISHTRFFWLEKYEPPIVWRLRRVYVWRGKLYLRRDHEPRATLTWIRWTEGNPDDWDWQCFGCHRWMNRRQIECWRC